MSRSAKEMAEDPANPYKIERRTGQFEGFDGKRYYVSWAVMNPDGTEYGVYDYKGAEWWAAHLYWEYLQSDRRAEQMLTGQEA